MANVPYVYHRYVYIYIYIENIYIDRYNFNILLIELFTDQFVFKILNIDKLQECCTLFNNEGEMRKHAALRAV